MADRCRYEYGRRISFWFKEDTNRLWRPFRLHLRVIHENVKTTFSKSIYSSGKRLHGLIVGHIELVAADPHGKEMLFRLRR